LWLKKISEIFTILTHNVLCLSTVVNKYLDSARFHSRPLQVVIHNQRFVIYSSNVADKHEGQSRNQKLTLFLIKTWTTLTLEASHSSEIQYLFTSQHGVTSQKTCILTFFKSERLFHVPPGLTFSISTWCSHCVYVFCTYLRKDNSFCITKP